jgi:hypothetical protein
MDPNQNSRRSPDRCRSVGRFFVFGGKAGPFSRPTPASVGKSMAFLCKMSQTLLKKTFFLL